MSEVPEDHILVQQVGTHWHITQRNRPVERFETLDEAVARGVMIFRGRRTAHLVIGPAESPSPNSRLPARPAEPWQTLFDDWMSWMSRMSRDVPAQSGGRPGAPFQFHTTAVFPLVVWEIRRQAPHLSEPQARGLLADYIRQVWVKRNEQQAVELELMIPRPLLIDRIRKACR